MRRGFTRVEVAAQLAVLLLMIAAVGASRLTARLLLPSLFILIGLFGTHIGGARLGSASGRMNRLPMAMRALFPLVGVGGVIGVVWGAR